MHILWSQRDLILEISLILVERVVAIDVFHIRSRFGSGRVFLGRIGSRRRVAVGACIVLVSFEYRLVLLVPVRTSVIVVIVASRIVDRREGVAHPLAHHGWINLLFDQLDIIAVCAEVSFVVVFQSVETHVLSLVAWRSVVEGIDCAGALSHTTPYCCGSVGRVLVDIQSVLERFQTVFQYVFRDFSEVEVEVASLVTDAVVVGPLTGDGRIHEPELDVFVVGILKIGHIHRTHHASPSFLRVEQSSVAAHSFAIHIVRTSFLRIEREVEHIEHTRLSVCQLLVWIYLVVVDLTYAMVRQLF